MKKIIALLMVVLSSLSFSAKKLYVGTNAEFKPYEYLEGDKIVGFDVDLMENLGKKMGYQIEWVNMNFDGLLSALQLKKIDAVIAGMAATDERKKAAAFSIPYMFFKAGHLVIVNEKDTTITSKKDLKGKTTGVQMGSIQEGFAKELGAEPKFYSTFTAALMDLQNGKVDSVIVADLVGKEYLKTMNRIKSVDVIEDTKPGASIAFRKSDAKMAEDFSKAIVEFKESPEYEKMVEKYFPERYDDFVAAKNKKK